MSDASSPTTSSRRSAASTSGLGGLAIEFRQPHARLVALHGRPQPFEFGPRASGLLRSHLPSLHPAPTQVRQEGGMSGQLGGAERGRGPLQRVGPQVKQLTHGLVIPLRQDGERLAHGPHPLAEPGGELQTHLGERVLWSHPTSSRIRAARPSGSNGFNPTPAAPLVRKRSSSCSFRAVSKTTGIAASAGSCLRRRQTSKTTGIAASAGSCLRRRQTSYPSITGIMTSSTITSGF